MQQSCLPERLLTKGLIQNNAGGIGKVKAPDIRVAHRYCITAVYIQLYNLFWQAFRFPAENQKISRLELSFRIRFSCLLGEKIKIPLIPGSKKLIQAFPVNNFYILPVVKPGAFQMLVIGTEPERLYQMQNRIGSTA